MAGFGATSSRSTKAGGPMKLLRRRHILILLAFILVFSAQPIFAQPASPDVASSEGEKFQARIDATAVALGDNPRFKNLSPKHRQELAEFITGNMLFVLLHEMAQVSITQLGLPVLGRMEDAEDFLCRPEARLGRQIVRPLVPLSPPPPGIRAGGALM
jgi:hypothetical protein